MRIKLDDLIRAVNGAHNARLVLEELEDRELERIRASYLALAGRARFGSQEGRDDRGQG